MGTEKVLAIRAGTNRGRNGANAHRKAMDFIEKGGLRECPSHTAL